MPVCDKGERRVDATESSLDGVRPHAVDGVGADASARRGGLGEKGSNSQNHSVSAINPQIFGVVSDR